MSSTPSIVHWRIGIAQLASWADFSGPERWSADWPGEVKDALEASVALPSLG